MCALLTIVQGALDDVHVLVWTDVYPTLRVPRAQPSWRLIGITKYNNNSDSNWNHSIISLKAIDQQLQSVISYSI